MPEVDFEFACLASEIPENGAKNVNIKGMEITIFHTVDRFIAHSGVCKHNGFKLELCEITGDSVVCPLHGWRYSISTGKGIKPAWTALETYPVAARGEELWVKPEADKSNEDEFDTSAFDW